MTPGLSGHISIFGLFFLRSGLFEELQDNGVVKSLKTLSYLLSLGVMLEFAWAI